MRILLDEDLPRRLASLLTGHDTSTVPQSGWAGVKNGRLLALAATKFDVLLTMDRNIEFQQNLATLPIATLVVEAISNRIEHLEPLVPRMLSELKHIEPGSLRRIALAEAEPTGLAPDSHGQSGEPNPRCSTGPQAL